MTIKRVNAGDKPKKTSNISFAGENGHKAFYFLEEQKRKGNNKSYIVVELVLLYKKMYEKFGEDALFEMRKKLEE